MEISKDSPSLYWTWRECARSFLGHCTKWEQKRDVYDLSKPEVRRQLIDAGFVMKVREKP